MNRCVGVFDCVVRHLRERVQKLMIIAGAGADVVQRLAQCPMVSSGFVPLTTRGRFLMTSRAPMISLAVLGVFALSACSAAGSPDDASSGETGLIEMAVSETCADEVDSECVSVNGENVLLPTVFEQAGVKDSSAAEGGQNAVDVTFDEAGAKVFQTLTKLTAESGESARLVIRIGGELQAAVAVMEAVEDDLVRIGLSSEDNAQDVVDLIEEG